MARIRYNSPEVKAYVTPMEGGVRVMFDQPQKSVTPGQSAVFYDGDVVLAGAIIDTPIGCEEQDFKLIDAVL
jgi:tRNA-specific 2-thiouridylase